MKRSFAPGPWAIVLILMGAMLVSLVDRFALASLLQPIRTSLHVADGDLGLLGGVSFGLFYAVLGLPLGYLADRWTRTGTIMVGVAVWCMATAACGLAGSFFWLLLARIFVGAGEAALAPASYSLIHDIFPPARLGRAMSVFQLGAVLGAGVAFVAVGSIYAPLVAGKGAGIPFFGDLQPWQQTFVLVALPGLAILPFIALIPETPPRSAGHRLDVRERMGLRTAFASNPPFFLLLFTTMVGVLTFNYSLLSWIPAIMSREFLRSIGESGKLYGLLVMVTSGAGLIFGGWLSDRLHVRNARLGHLWIPLLSGSLLLPMGIALLWCSTWERLLFVLSISHFAIGLPVGSVPALIQLRTPRDARSRVSSVYVLVVNLFGLGVGPTLVGFLSQHMGSRPDGLRLAVGQVAGVSAAIAVSAAVALLTVARSSDGGASRQEPV